MALAVAADLREALLRLLVARRHLPILGVAVEVEAPHLVVDAREADAATVALCERLLLPRREGHALRVVCELREGQR